MNPKAYLITAQTNLHAGSGDANYGIIDKLVQRDVVTDFPVINASSLKGAILQHFYFQNGMTDDYIDIVFGGQTNVKKRLSGKSRSESKSGEFIFMQANLVSIPVRANGNMPFYRVSCPLILRELSVGLQQTGLLQVDDPFLIDLNKLAELAQQQPVSLGGEIPNLRLEDKSYSKVVPSGVTNNKILELLGENAIVVPDKDMTSFCDNHHLPVIARNYLENGQSANLWYEQIVPRQSRFLFSVLHPTTKQVTQYDGSFEKRLTTNGLIQIGANASVGYGYCTIKNFNPNL